MPSRTWSRRSFLKAAVLAPVAAAAAPLAGQKASREYVRFKAAKFDQYEKQILWSGNLVVRSPRMMMHMYGITA